MPTKTEDLTGFSFYQLLDRLEDTIENVVPKGTKTKKLSEPERKQKIRALIDALETEFDARVGEDEEDEDEYEDDEDDDDGDYDLAADDDEDEITEEDRFEDAVSACYEELDLEVAFDIVVDLAAQNQLDRYDLDVYDQAVEQEAAIRMVNEHIYTTIRTLPSKEKYRDPKKG